MYTQSADDDPLSPCHIPLPQLNGCPGSAHGLSSLSWIIFLTHPPPPRGHLQGVCVLSSGS